MSLSTPTLMLIIRPRGKTSCRTMVQTRSLLRRESGLLLAIARVKRSIHTERAAMSQALSVKIVILNRSINVGGTSSWEQTGKSYRKQVQISANGIIGPGRIKEAASLIIGKLPGRKPRRSCWILKRAMPSSPQIMLKITAGTRVSCQSNRNNSSSNDCYNWSRKSKKPIKDCKKRLPESRLKAIALKRKNKKRQSSRRKSNQSRKRRRASSKRGSWRRRRGRPKKPLF